MDKAIIQPLINPVKFIDMNPVTLPQYLSRHFDDFFYLETLKPWQQRKTFAQPWQTTDAIRFQLQSMVAPIKYSIIDSDERVYLSANMDQLFQNVNDPNLWIHQADIALNALPEGLYFIRLDCGNMDANGDFKKVLISEPLHIANRHKDTVYLNYKHYEYYSDVIFETGFSPYLRIKGTLRLKSLSSKDTLFEDQVLDMQMLRSKPFRVWELLIGGSTGIPDYLADMLLRILGCSDLTIDGKPFTKGDGAKMEEQAQANYPMRGWSIELREAVNSSSKTYSVEPSAGRISIIATVDSKGFGLGNAGSGEEQIKEFI